VSPKRKTPRHRMTRGVMNQPAFGHYVDCKPCGHVGGLFSTREGATAQFEEHKRTGKSQSGTGVWS